VSFKSEMRKPISAVRTGSPSLYLSPTDGTRLVGTSFSELGPRARVVWSKSPLIRVPSVGDTYPKPLLRFISCLPRRSGQCMNIGSVLYRLQPVQGKYRSINYEYIWAMASMRLRRKGFGLMNPGSEASQGDKDGVW
jgi:hypothetical protein